MLDRGGQPPLASPTIAERSIPHHHCPPLAQSPTPSAIVVLSEAVIRRLPSPATAE
ncbi:MAG: hypothetical protein HY532_04010 [Chloroflexi bacterium]|nr:hypothetical protein [Chloroflexota bacterium]